MATIEAQLELEALIMQRTADRFHANTDEAESKGRASGTGACRRLLQIFLDDLSTDLIAYCKVKSSQPGPGGKYFKLIQRVSPELCIQIALQEMFDGVFAGKSLQDISVRTGMRIEDDIKFSAFRDKEPDYYKTVIKDFKSRGTTEYRHIHRVLTNKMHEFEVEWNDWASSERYKVGEYVIKVIMETTPLFEFRKNPNRGKGTDPTTLLLTDYAEEWVGKFKDYAQFLRPLGAPCIIPPKDWEGMNHGGFYSPELQSKFPFVRTRHQKHIQDGNFTEHMQAVNKLQSTAWSINPRTRHFLSWATEHNFTAELGLPATQPYTFPQSPYPNMDKDDMTEEQAAEFLNWKRETARLHTAERKRYTEATAVWRLTKMADDYAEYNSFYFVYTCDFRGRIYPVTAGLSPQGADYSKGLLQFANGKRLGMYGWYWLRVHGANLLGYDKDTYDGRVRYIDGLREQICAAGNNPCSTESVRFIASADKPMQFLAFCCEYADAESLDSPTEFVSSIPVGLDGSCNGLQNFSAVLRDEVGGLATNVLPGDLPNDIYGEVANVAVRTLTRRANGDCGDSKKLLSIGITRKTTKRSVMTLPYGLTKHSSGEYVGEWLREHIHLFIGFTDFNSARNVLNDAVWDAIGEVVTSAREGMAWLQDVAGVAGREDMPLIWTSPTGFKVYQEDNRSKTKVVRSALAEISQVKLREWTDKIDVSSLKNGSAPNYIHSLDAAHLVKTTLEANGDLSWQMIHDDFGTHACDIPELHRAIRVSFYKMYANIDRLDIFRREIAQYLDGELPALPTLGDMDVSRVLESEYFFG